MALTFTGTNGLFTRLGKIFKQPYLWAVNQAAVQANYNKIVNAFASPDQGVVSGIPAAVLAARQGIGATWKNTMSVAAQQTVIQMVFDDNPSQAGTLTSALNEVIRQMNNQSATVATCAVACSSASIPSVTNKGNGTIVINTTRGDGNLLQNIVAEVANIIVTADSQTGGTSLGNEIWQYVGAADNGDPSLNDVWPTGSGAQTNITGVSPFVSPTGTGANGGNVLTNGDMETWSGSPLGLNGWTMTTGTFATNIVKNTTGANVYTNGASAKFVGDGSSTFGMQQQFGSGSGTTATLTPDKSYSYNFFAMFDTPPAAGVLTVDLYDGTAVIQDDKGVNQSKTFTLSAFTNAFVAYNGTFRLPRKLPATVYIRFRITTAISNSSNLFIDTLAMGATTELYKGGPGVTIFPGSLPWIAGDGFKLTSTNDRAGQTYNGTFEAMFDATMGMRGLGLILPYASSNSADVQTIACGYTPTGGTFTLTLTLPDGTQVTTAAIAYNAAASDIQAAIQATSGIPSNFVSATAGAALPAGTPIITTDPKYGYQTLMTVNAAALTGGTPSSPRMTVTHTASGTPTISDGLITI